MMRIFPLGVAAFLTAAAAATTAPVLAQEPQWRHASALTGQPKYSEGFDHFDYVNPDAPKGGTIRLHSVGSFDNLNFVPRKGDPALGLGLIYDTLMEPAYDELDISADYGLLAEAVQYPKDASWVKYRLREGARWHDGEPITPDDVVWSFEVLTENNPGQAFYYRHVEKAEVTGEREVTFTFDQAGNRELPHIVGQLPILPKHYWTAEGRDITASTVEAPLGSGPYRIGSVVPGRSITYERVDDYWGKDLPTKLGTNNFDEIRYEYYRDADVARQAFKADEYDWYQELSANRWATQYDFPAIDKGWVKKLEFPDVGSGRMQGYTFNLRREKFQDPRLRRAFNLAYDFESSNERLSYGLNERIDSYFAGTDLAASGLPEGEELEILKSVEEEVDGEGIPQTVFTEPYDLPVGGSPQALRANLREASRLLKEAGYELRNGKLTDTETGEPLQVEILLSSPGAERGALAYKADLEKLGIGVQLRTVDSSQYVRRVRARDFDIAIFVWGQSLSPGNEQNEYWGSEAADRPGSQNYAGIKNPAIDALIQRIVFADDRETLVAATHALDRVLLHNEYVVPQFRAPNDRIVYWDRIDHPETLPKFTPGFPTIWWYDEEKAARIAREKN
ncbi:extracellular solute-binding protein [Amorphus orientalis]|uniref:Microcin C transport system substrate-binding protein n=1 Tax=Amorphus orientalis TaxID=649198 RepID=A0AAE3VP51_9HYPH|nr:extracellular solute-binding protein [Amorphus orientalis]MDQ0315220.1 microcin C transport system substrate-binding protein [Amorphus orientalis]